MLRMITTSVAPGATTIPFVPATRTEATWPPPPSRVMDFVMVTAPKPPGSSASISPPAAVLGIAPPHVLHAAVRLHGLTSSPRPQTHIHPALPTLLEPPNTTHPKKLMTLFISP